MPAIRFGADHLLEYNSEYSLLICRQCQYAIQKNALASHFLRHKIYRGDRQRLLSSIAHLHLLEPEHVPLPPPGSPPVDSLPILSGYRCTAVGCQHLTVSSKRMKRHWSEIHGSVPLSSSFARPVKLQTFFRGIQIRYFEVASPTEPLVNADDDGDDDVDGGKDGHERCEEGHDAITATSPSPPRVQAPSEITHRPSPTDFNLETLTYFHHFTTMTSLTLPGAEDLQCGKHYWQKDVVLRALRRHWLMCGLLAISAQHLAALRDDIMTKQIHLERGQQFISEFSTGLGQMTVCESSPEAAQIEDEAKKTGEQIRCLLRCAQWMSTEPTFNNESVASHQLLSIMVTIRGCVIPDSTLSHSDIENGVNPQMNSSNNNTPSALLDLLHALPFRMADRLGRPASAEDIFATLSAITTVLDCCAISFACDETGAAWQGVATWLIRVSDHFHQMVGRDDPAALVVLSHWAAILVKRAEHVGCWFLKGAAKMIMLQIRKQLSVNGRIVLDLVEYLMDMVHG